MSQDDAARPQSSTIYEKRQTPDQPSFARPVLMMMMMMMVMVMVMVMVMMVMTTGKEFDVYS